MLRLKKLRFPDLLRIRQPLDATGPYPSIPTLCHGGVCPGIFGVSSGHTNYTMRHCTRASLRPSRHSVFLSWRNLPPAELWNEAVLSQSCQIAGSGGSSLTCPANRTSQTGPRLENSHQSCSDMETQCQPVPLASLPALGFPLLPEGYGGGGVGGKPQPIRASSISRQALLCLRQKAGI